MSRTNFPLFLSHLDFAHHFWSKLIQPGNSIIDATCGNGLDSLKLCHLTLSSTQGKVYCFDIQNDAIEASIKHLSTNLDPTIFQRVYFEKRCHSTFPAEITKESIHLIVYNLGYLPGGDKTKTTKTELTLQSIETAKELLLPGGILSITCYPGHLEGEKEQNEICDYARTLSPKKWSCSHHTWINRKNSPSVLLIQKTILN